MILLELFLSFLKIGLFSFGGGYAAIPLIQSEIMDNHHWLDYATFSDILAISQMTPGPIGINAATFIGIQLQGIPGALVATIAFVIPSFIIVLILGHLYLKYKELVVVKKVLEGVKPVIIAVILAAGVSMLLKAIFMDKDILLTNLNYFQVLFFIVAFIMSYKYKLSPIIIMLIIGLCNLTIYLII